MGSGDEGEGGGDWERERETWELGKCRGYPRAVYLTLGAFFVLFGFVCE